jgi:hypothetical protein
MRLGETPATLKLAVLRALSEMDIHLTLKIRLKGPSLEEQYLGGS